MGTLSLTLVLLFSPSLGTFPAAAAVIVLLFLIIALTHSWASGLILVLQDVAGELGPLQWTLPEWTFPLSINQTQGGEPRRWALCRRQRGTSFSCLCAPHCSF